MRWWRWWRSTRLGLRLSSAFGTAASAPVRQHARMPMCFPVTGYGGLWAPVRQHARLCVFQSRAERWHVAGRAVERAADAEHEQRRLTERLRALLHGQEGELLDDSSEAKLLQGVAGTSAALSSPPGQRPRQRQPHVAVLVPHNETSDHRTCDPQATPSASTYERDRLDGRRPNNASTGAVAHSRRQPQPPSHQPVSPADVVAWEAAAPTRPRPGIHRQRRPPPKVPTPQLHWSRRAPADRSRRSSSARSPRRPRLMHTTSSDQEEFVL
jgi:hypothetical protein